MPKPNPDYEAIRDAYAARKYAVRCRATWEIIGKWYDSPGRAATAFKIARETCHLPWPDYEVVDSVLARPVARKRYTRPVAVLYGLRWPDGTEFGWYVSAEVAFARYKASHLFAKHLWDGEDVGEPEVITKGKEPEVIAGMYALQSIRHKWLYTAPRGQTWFGRPAGAVLAWKADRRNWTLPKPLLRSGLPRKRRKDAGPVKPRREYQRPNFPTLWEGLRKFQMVRGGEGGKIEVLECYDLRDVGRFC